MCIGFPGQVLAVGDDIHQVAQVGFWCIQAYVNFALIWDGSPAELMGHGVVLHVGFAMSI
uniref:HypC/HybG/HupF family hydrogenase formation chaperone n=1 Tax=Salmonella enterica TaxID=28901 RepID=UPI00398C3AC5